MYALILYPKIEHWLESYNILQDILMGDSQIVLAGGSDSMSQAPYAVRNIRFGTKLGVDIKLEDMMWAALTDFHCKTPVS